MDEDINKVLEVLSIQRFNTTWNIFLAIIPFVLALLLFKTDVFQRAIWRFPLTIIFLLFLPNAPYLITDCVHFSMVIREGARTPFWKACSFFGEYFLLATLGMQIFVISIDMWMQHLRKKEWNSIKIVSFEVLILMLSSYAIYLGRFSRANSWDVITDPHKIIEASINVITNNNVHKHDNQLKTLLFIFTILVILYITTKTFNRIAALINK